MSQHAIVPVVLAPMPMTTTHLELLNSNAAKPDADHVVQLWLAQYGPRTRESYEADIRHWAHWLGQIGLGTWDVKRSHASAYARWTETLTLSASTRARRLSTPSSFYAFAASEDIIETNPFANVRRPKVSNDSPTKGLSQLQFRAFLDEAAKEGSRSHALACLLGLSGLRVNEACTLRADEIGRHSGHHTITVTRKGGKRQMMAVAPETAEALERAVALPRIDDRALGWGRSYSGVVVARLGVKARIPFHVHPHALRHTFITLSLNAGASMRDVQAAAGHASATMTQRYDREAGSLARSPVYVLSAQVAAYESPYATT